MRPTTKSLIAAAALVLGIGAQAQAQTVRLTAILSGGNEAPTPLLSGATGIGEVFVNMATKEVTYTVKVFNLPSGATAGHFHVGVCRRGRPGGGRYRATGEHLQRLHADRHGYRGEPACSGRRSASATGTTSSRHWSAARATSTSTRPLTPAGRSEGSSRSHPRPAIPSPSTRKQRPRWAARPCGRAAHTWPLY